MKLLLTLTTPRKQVTFSSFFFLLSCSAIFSFYILLLWDVSFAFNLMSGNLYKFYKFFLYSISFEFQQIYSYILFIITILAGVFYFPGKNYKTSFLKIFIFSVISVIYPYSILISYKKFMFYLPVLTIFFGVVILVFIHLFLILFDFKLKKQINLVFQFFSFVLSFSLYILNRNLFFGDYLSFHYSIFLLSYLLLFLSIFSLSINYFSKIKIKKIVTIFFILFIPVIFYFKEKHKFIKRKYYHSKVSYLDNTISGSSSFLFIKDQAIFNLKKKYKVINDNAKKMDLIKSIQVFKQQINYPLLKKNFNPADYNILFLLGDATQYLQTSLASPKFKNTPFLKQIASEAFNFEKVFSPSSRTITSVNAILNMNYPSFLDLDLLQSRTWIGKLNNANNYISKLLGQQGFYTIFASGMHMTKANLGIEKNFQHNYICRKYGKKIKKYKFKCDFALNRFLKKQIFKSSKLKKKFFAYAHYYSPHYPHRRYKKKKKFKNKLKVYREEIKFLDKRWKELIKFLKRKNLYEKTIIIFSADHGEDLLGSRINRYRRDIYSGATRVPLIIRIPGYKAKTIKLSTSSNYIFSWLFANAKSTIGDRARTQIQNYFSPMLQALDGAHIIEINEYRKMKVALIKKNYKYHYNFISNISELYNIGNDSFELKNLITKKPLLVKDFKNKLKKYLSLRAKNEKLKFVQKISVE